MGRPYFSTNLFSILVAALLLASTSQQSRAEGATDAKPLELRKIMQELGKNMQSIVDGISREDWALVAKVAPQVAEHRQPPAGEKMRILAFIGTRTSEFKGYDGQTHDAAQALEQAAARNDGEQVIAAFAKLQSGCLACHQRFRQPLVEHFYGRR